MNFICESIIERVRNRSMSIWGKKGQCDPPYVVMPLTIEPSKPRLCHDERFLNLWMKTPKVSFDPITDVPQYVDAGHFQSKLDDKSGYDHISLTQESRTFFGLCWLDWFFVYTTLLFGQSPSSYIYHNIGLGPSHFIRSRGVPLSQYIDDRHVGQLRISQSMSNSWSNLDLANAAIYIASLVLVSCGYFNGLKKSILIPSQSIPYLGFISDSLKQAFILRNGKKEKFTFLRESLINSNFVSIKSLQRFAGKAVSFSLAVPAAKLFCREINSHIGKGLRSSKPLRMTRSLKDELSSWRFLDTWHGFLPWRDEKHFSVEVTTDASNSGWAGILSSPEGSKNTRDYWSNEVVEGTDIAIKEARALYNTLSTFGSEVFNSRVTAFIDNSNLISFLNNEGSKSIALSNEIKDLFCLSVNLNISLRMTYVPSDSNSADSSSRFYSDLDCTLSQVTWSQAESQIWTTLI